MPGCKKEGFVETLPGHQKWMRVLEDTIISSTDDETFQGMNGKVLTDDYDNVYLYYYNSARNYTAVMMLDPLGKPLWKKSFPDCIPTDMILSHDGNLILAVRASMVISQGLLLYVMKRDSSIVPYQFGVSGIFNDVEINNATINQLNDNSYIISGSIQQKIFTNGQINNNGFILKLTQSFLHEWTRVLNESELGFQYADAFFGQNSIAQLVNGNYIFEFGISREESISDSLGYGLLTGIIDATGNLGTTKFYFTGYKIKSTGDRQGFRNRYCNGILSGSNGAIYHYSSPEQFIPGQLSVPNGFYVLDNHASIIDTIPLQLPAGYRILSYQEKNGRFFMHTHKSGVASGTNDFSATQTHFLFGDNYQTREAFYFQEFYADFFPSSAYTTDGSYIVMGKIQSFNETNNKLILIKWNPN